MTATHRKFTFITGDTWPIDATCSDVNNKPIDLATASTLQWTLMDQDGAVIASAALGSGIELVVAAHGLALITLAPATTIDIKPGFYQDVLKLTMSDGMVSTQAVGLIEVVNVTGIMPTTTAPVDLNAELESLKSARRSGVLRTRFSDREVQYKSDAEMRSAIAALENEIAGGSNNRVVNIRSKGWS